MKRSIFTSVIALGLFLMVGSFASAQVTPAGTVPTNATNPPAATGSVAAPSGPVEIPVKQGGGIFQFEEETHDFGELMQGGDASWVFKFTNVGTEDIVITTAKGSCGCTVPTWSSEPIAPGKTGEIAVKYDSNRIGGIAKNVTIISNAAGGEKVIYIKGNILPKPVEPGQEAPAPAPGH